MMNTNIDFSRWRWHALMLSLAVILSGIVTIAVKGMALGIDFSGGTLLVVEFTGPDVTEEQVRSAIASLPGEEVVQRYGRPEEHQFLIRLPLLESDGESESLDAAARRVAQALQGSELPGFEVVDRQLVSAAIGADLQRRGVYATLASIVAITGYIAIRFRSSSRLVASSLDCNDVWSTLARLAPADDCR